MRVSIAERRRTPVWGVIAAATAVAGGAIAFLGLDNLPWTMCMFKAMTGRPCITCGATRALGRLGIFDLHGAWMMNPLATAALLSLLAWGSLELFLAARGRGLQLDVSPRESAAIWFGAAVLLLVNWAYLIQAGR